KELSIFCTNTSTGLNREPTFSPFVKEVDRRAEQHQQGPESRVDYGRPSSGGGGAIATDVGVNGQHQEGQRENREERRQNRIAGDAVRARRSRFLAAQNDDAVRASGVKDPSHEDQGVGNGVERAAEEQRNAPGALQQERS